MNSGNLLTEYGQIIRKKNHRVVHIQLKKGDTIAPHNHEGEDVYFTVVKGNANVFLDKSESHDIKAGQALSFDGIHYISAEALEDTEVFVFLIAQEQ